MIQGLFGNTLEVSLASSAAIVIVCALLPLLENKYMAKLRYCVLLLIVLRLLIPIPITMPDAPIQINTTQIEQQYENWKAPVPSEITVSEGTKSQNKNQTDSYTNNSRTLTEKSAIVWFVGMLLFLTVSFIRYLSYLRRLHRWFSAADSDQKFVFETIKSNLKIKRGVSLHRCRIIESPMQLGIVNPMVLIPYKDYSETDLYLILKHELMHFKRHDVEVKVLIFLAQALHWFNPFVYLLSKKLNEAIEMCCDEHVINGIDSLYKKRYMETIFDSINHSTAGTNLFTTNYNGGMKVMKKRFCNIIDSGSKKKGIFVLTLLIVACLGASSLVTCDSNAAAGNNEATKQEETEQQKPENISETIKGVYAEAEPNAELEKIIIDSLEIPTEYFDKTNYYYNYVDLNNDGSDEIFAVVMGTYTSGTGGSTAVIISQPGTKDMKVDQIFTLIQTPIIISDKITNGCNEIIAMNSGGGASGQYVVMTATDGKYQTINEATPIEGLEGVSGTAIICNDMIKDLEDGKVLYLQQN